MPNGDAIAAGKSFLDIRSWYKQDPAWASVRPTSALRKPGPTSSDVGPGGVTHRWP
jgi:hypothetical protein